jgi:alpha-tubulin suppressor-like RCC1 family protein
MSDERIKSIGWTFAGLAAVVLAALGVLASSALAEPGEMYAFGNNFAGQLGTTAFLGEPHANPTPALVQLPGVSIRQLAAGGAHTLAVTSSGQLYSFGLNDFGQLGVMADSETHNPNPSPQLVGLPGSSGSVVQVAAGANHSLVVTSAGQLYAFGDNEFGQLGTSTEHLANPTPVLVSLPGASGPVVQVAAGENHSLAVTSTGQLYSFGLNQSGQLGRVTNNGGGAANPTPELVSLPGATGPVTQVAAGERHSLALTSTGQLYSFGDNKYGQLGREPSAMEANPNPGLVNLPGASGPVTEIVGGGYHSLAVTATGQLYSFGENRYGQLGVAANSGTEVANQEPALVNLPGESGGVTQLAAGLSDSLAVTSTGQLYAFGENQFGQLGIVTDSGQETPNPAPSLVALPVGSTIDMVARGPSQSSSLALIADLSATTTTLSAAEAGVGYSADLQANGGTPPYRWTVGGLPAGLTANSESGQITGTPTSAGSSSVTYTVTDAYGITTSSTAIALTVLPDNGGTLAPAALPPEPDARLLTGKLSANASGVLTVEVSCPAYESRCAGTITLRTLDAGDANASRHRSVKRKSTAIILAVGSFTVAGGHVGKIKLRLSGNARALLKHTHTLHALATIVARDPAGRAHTTKTEVTIRVARTLHG